MAKEEKASVWSSYTEADKEALEKLAAGYRDFLSTCKTERESVREAVRQAEGAGYRDLQDVLRSGEKLKAGDKVAIAWLDNKGQRGNAEALFAAG